jgi:hypothetical protein
LNRDQGLHGIVLIGQVKRRVVLLTVRVQPAAHPMIFLGFE